MYDEITNSDLICTLIETAHPIGKPHPEHWELMLEAARRIEKLDVRVRQLEHLADKWESWAEEASNCDTPDKLQAFLHSL